METTQVTQAQLIDGRALGQAVRDSVAKRVAESGRPVRLDAVLVGSDRAAEIYASKQESTCAAVGIEYVLQEFALLFGQHDQKEGMSAFLEKRSPDYADLD